MPPIVQPNMFQFPQNVIATTIKPMDIGGRTIPAGHKLRIRGYRSDRKYSAESALPGSNRIWEFSFPEADVNNIQIEKTMLKEQLTSIMGLIAEANPVRLHVESLAKSLGN